MLREIADSVTTAQLIAVGDSNIGHGTALYRELTGGFVNVFDDTATLCGPRGTSFCVDYMLLRGWDAYELRTLLIGETAAGFPPSARRGHLSDHVSLGLRIA